MFSQLLLSFNLFLQQINFNLFSKIFFLQISNVLQRNISSKSPTVHKKKKIVFQLSSFVFLADFYNFQINQLLIELVNRVKTSSFFVKWKYSKKLMFFHQNEVSKQQVSVFIENNQKKIKIEISLSET